MLRTRTSVELRVDEYRYEHAGHFMSPDFSQRKYFFGKLARNRSILTDIGARKIHSHFPEQKKARF